MPVTSTTTAVNDESQQTKLEFELKRWEKEQQKVYLS
jgi:hypothetical protein